MVDQHIRRSYYDNIVKDIRVKIGDTWQAASDDQCAAYIAYKSRANYFMEDPYTHNNGITIFREDNNGYHRNDCYMPTFFRLSGSLRNPGAKYPIIDMNDICVFLMDGVVGNGSRNGAGWVKARNYQAWAYVDFIYDRAMKKCYMSKYSTYLAFPPGFDRHNVVTIDMDDLPPNIIFSISRNENNSVYYERNDSSNSRVRICDNEYARAGFLGYYTRITMDVSIEITPPTPSSVLASPSGNNIQMFLTNNSLPMPPIIETVDEEDQCILCYKNMKNVEYKPCNHTISCIACFERLLKKECPICKAEIVKIGVA
jgi:hypothetical protein